MTSPARRHFLKTKAAIESTKADEKGSMRGLSQYELMLVKLNSDRRRLSDIESVSRKADVKREVLPEYDSYIQGVLLGGNGVQDEVLVTIMVWSLDADDIDRALPVIDYAIKHKLTLPDSYNRTLPTAVVDEFASSVQRIYKSTQQYPLPALQKIEQLTVQEDMPDQARAKLYRYLGEAYDEVDQKENALKSYSRAYELNEKSGVKTRLNQLTKELDV